MNVDRNHVHKWGGKLFMSKRLYIVLLFWVLFIAITMRWVHEVPEKKQLDTQNIIENHPVRR